MFKLVFKSQKTLRKQSEFCMISSKMLNIDQKLLVGYI